MYITVNVYLEGGRGLEEKRKKIRWRNPSPTCLAACLLHNIPILFESPFIYHKIKNSRREGAGVTRLFKK